MMALAVMESIVKITLGEQILMVAVAGMYLAVNYNVVK